MARGVRRAAVEAGPVEEPWELPDGWRWERLQDVAEVNPRTELNLSDDEPMTFVPMAAVSEETGVIDVTQTRKAADVAKGFTRFREGDVLFAKITPCMENGKIAEVPALKSVVGAGSTEFHVIRSNAFCRSFLLHYLLQPTVRQQAERNMSGSAGQKRVPADYLRLLPVPVPPLDAQRRIVARIEELLSEIVEGEWALREVSQLATDYRHSLLHAAVTGRLTWATGKSKRGGEDCAADNQLPPLPPTWRWVSLGQLINGIEAGLNVKAEGRPPVDGETGIIKVSAVTWDEFDEDASKTLPSAARYKERDLIQPGDFLISRANTLELVGAPAIVRNISRRLVLSDKVLRLLMSDELKEWVYFVLKSPLGRREIEARSTGNQLSMRNIPQEAIRALPIPVPPADELEQLTAMIRDLWSTTRSLESSLDDELSPAHLRQSILAAAFRGDLVA